MPRFLPLVPLAAIAIAYANVLGAGFVWDDHALIENNPIVRELASPSEYFGKMFWADPLDEERSFYRPLVTLSYALEWRLWAGDPLFFHLTNVLLHLGVAALLYALARKWGADPTAAALSVMLFGTFPRLTESVTWVSGRTDVLAALFGLLFVLVHDPDRRGRRIAAAGLLLLALLAKEVALVFAAGVVAHAAVAKPRRWRTFIEPAVAVSVYFILRIVAASAVVRPQLANIRGDLGAGERVTAALAAIGTYGYMMLDALRPRLQIGSLRAPSLPLAVAGFLMLAAASVWLWRGRGRIQARTAFAAAAAAGALLLVVHLVPLSVNVLSADRFLYVPVAMLALLSSWAMSSWLGGRRTAAVVVCALLGAAFVVATHLRNEDWSDEYRLWKHEVERREPANTRPLFALAGLLMEASLHERAMPYLEQAIALEAAFPELKTYNAWAVCLDNVGRRGEAIELLEKMSAQQPNAARVRLNLAMAHARQLDFDRALNVLGSLRGAVVGEDTLRTVVDAVTRAKESLRSRDFSTQPGAATADLGERARIAETLGARPEAQALYVSVLGRPDASAELRMRALSYLAFFGDPTVALSQLKNHQGGQADVLVDAAAERNRLQ